MIEICNVKKSMNAKNPDWPSPGPVRLKGLNASASTHEA